MTTKEKTLWAAIVIVLGGVGYVAYNYFAGGAANAPPKAEVTPSPMAETSAEPAVRNPIPGDASGDASQPLPTLAESDSALAEALGQLFGEDTVAAQLVRENIVRNIVVTVDNLPRQKVAVERRPVKATGGTTLVTGDADSGEVVTLNVQNYARYAPFVKAVQAADVQQVSALYFHWYPLFQQAYEDLGYPGKYFNDRLVESIDDLLKTPDVAGPIRLVRPKVFFEYADPALEGRSAGQKLLLRMGPDNAAAIKAKLRDLRAVVAGRKP
jgi:hypothetical protein